MKKKIIKGSLVTYNKDYFPDSRNNSEMPLGIVIKMINSRHESTRYVVYWANGLVLTYNGKALSNMSA
jgi:hypothetical protein